MQQPCHCLRMNWQIVPQSFNLFKRGYKKLKLINDGITKEHIVYRHILGNSTTAARRYLLISVKHLSLGVLMVIIKWGLGSRTVIGLCYVWVCNKESTCPKHYNARKQLCYVVNEERTPFLMNPTECTIWRENKQNGRRRLMNLHDVRASPRQWRTFIGTHSIQVAGVRNGCSVFRH